MFASYPLRKINFGQQQVSAAVGWLGDGGLLFHAQDAVRWLVLSIQQVQASQMYFAAVLHVLAQLDI